MLSQIRRIQKGLLIVVTILIVIAFAFLYSEFDFVQGTLGRQQCAVKVYDRCYRAKEFRKLATNYEVAIRLGMGDFASVLFGENRRDSDVTDFVMSLIILRTEADRLGIHPSDDEVREATPNLPVFQQPWVDAAYVQNNILGPSGFTDGDLAQLVRDYLAFQKLRELIGSGAVGIPSEAERIYTRRNQVYTASVAYFDREDFIDGIEISDEDVAEYFERNREDLNSSAKRGFDYVVFAPKPLPEDATNEQAAIASRDFLNSVNRAYAGLADQDTDFLEAARRIEGEQEHFSATVGSLEPFGTDAPSEMVDGDPTALGEMFNEAMPLGGVTIPVPTEDEGYMVFHYREYRDPEPLSLEEATPAIREALLAQRSNREVNDAASEARAAIQEALDAGRSLDEAAEAAGVEFVSLPTYSAMEPPAETPNPSLIVSNSFELGENELSSVVERPDGLGFLLLHVEGIEIYENEDREADLDSIAASVGFDLKRTLFTAWLNRRRFESGAERPVFGTAEG